jgi:hypothetical protein
MNMLMNRLMNYGCGSVRLAMDGIVAGVDVSSTVTNVPGGCFRASDK